MSYYVFDSKGYVGDLASNTGFMELREFIVNQGDPALSTLFTEGCAKVADVLKPLRRLKKSDNPDVQLTVRNLQALAGDCDEIIILTDGVIEEEETEKGGPGSGPQEGHPFYGNQWVEGMAGGGEGGNISREQVQALRDDVEHWGGEREQIGRAALNEIKNGMPFVAMHRGGSLQGVAAMDFSFGLKQDTIYVNYLAAKRGYGSKMMARIAEKAAELGKGLTLTSLPSAIGFYQKLGFTKLNPQLECYMSAKDVKRFAKAKARKEDEPFELDEEALLKLEPEDGCYCTKGRGKGAAEKGGAGSGNWGHEGRPGERGGSAPSERSVGSDEKPGSSGGESETVYHGTSFRAVGEILVEGIRSGEYRNWSDHFYEGGRAGVVFVARGENGMELARAFAEKAEAESGKAAVIIEAKVPRAYFDEHGKRDKAMPYDKYTGFEAMSLPEVKADWITNVYDKNGVVATKTINSLTGLRFKEKEEPKPKKGKRQEPKTHEEVRGEVHKGDTVTVYIPVPESALKKMDAEEAKKRKKK